MNSTDDRRGPTSELPGRGSGTSRRPDGIRRGDVLLLLPELFVLATAALGAVSLGGRSRWLCVAAVVAAAAGLAFRIARRDRRGEADVTRIVLACAPSVALMAVIVWTSHSRPPAKPAGPSAPPSAIRLADASAEARDCLSSEEAGVYLDALYQRLQATWDVRDEPRESGFVVLGFVLDAEGKVRLSRVIDQSSDDYRAVGVATLEQASPFGELKGELACLEHLELRATLDRSGAR